MATWVGVEALSEIILVVELILEPVAYGFWLRVLVGIRVGVSIGVIVRVSVGVWGCVENEI